MSQTIEFDDSLKFRFQLHAVHVMSYVAAMLGFFIFGLVLFVAPVSVLGVYAPSIPFDTSFDDLFVVNVVASFILGIVWRNLYKIQNHWMFSWMTKDPLRDWHLGPIDDPAKLEYILEQCQNEEYGEFFGELRWNNATHNINLETCKWETSQGGASSDRTIYSVPAQPHDGRSQFPKITEDAAVTILIIVVSLVGISAVGAFIYTWRRK